MTVKDITFELMKDDKETFLKPQPLGQLTSAAGHRYGIRRGGPCWSRRHTGAFH